ncbi:hypothetical protein HFN89_01980 [Rhizobium laguerreae]|nr:hypothetical protein [Rhizobium laguerreae]
MTPNEFYALPFISADYWRRHHIDIAIEVLQLEGVDYDPHRLEEFDSDRLVVHEKLHHDIDGTRGVSLYAFYLDAQPFALMFTGGRGGRDSRKAVITNATLWCHARTYALSVMSAGLKPKDDIVAADQEFTDHFYGSRVARFGDGSVRLVAWHDVNPLTKNPVYDRTKFDESFDALIRPLGEKVGHEQAIEVFRSGVLGDKIDVDIDLGDGKRIVAVSVVDGQTFAHVADIQGKHYSWARQGVEPRMLGPASLLDCYRDLDAGKDITLDHAYVREAAETFGAEPAAVLEETMDFIKNGGTSMAERIILRMPRDVRVPETLTSDHEVFTLGYMVLDNPDLRRFCCDGYPDAEQARKIAEMAVDFDRRISGGELKSPAPSR